MRINIHTHIFPKTYLESLREFGMLKIENGITIVNESGDEFGYKYEIFDSMWDIGIRLKVMDKLGVNVELLSIGNPWLSYIPREKAASIARRLNIELASIVKGNKQRFAALGIVPITSEYVLEELDYAVNELGLKGFMIGTHVNGKPVGSEEFLPIFERVARLDVPIYIHPLASRDVYRHYDRATATSIIFPTETVLFAKRAFDIGLFEKYPSLKIILAHLGGNLPFVLGRLDRAFSKKKNDIHESFVKSFYLDSVSYFTPPLEYAAKLWGSDRIMFGTDYPQIWGDSLERTVEVITKSKFSEREKEEILSGNAAKLFRL